MGKKELQHVAAIYETLATARNVIRNLLRIGIQRSSLRLAKHLYNTTALVEISIYQPSSSALIEDVFKIMYHYQPLSVEQPTFQWRRHSNMNIDTSAFQTIALE